jgi:hypothetical protein
MKTVRVTIEFTPRDFPEEPTQWTTEQWMHEIKSLLEDEHRGLAEYQSAIIQSIRTTTYPKRD